MSLVLLLEGWVPLSLSLSTILNRFVYRLKTVQFQIFSLSLGDDFDDEFINEDEFEENEDAEFDEESDFDDEFDDDFDENLNEEDVSYFIDDDSLDDGDKGDDEYFYGEYDE